MPVPDRPTVPGVYVGAWRIVSVLGIPLAGARHLALCLVAPGGSATVWELIGPVEHARNHVEPAERPRYAGWAGYRWVRAADHTGYDRAAAAAAAARADYAGRVYVVADSNRFVGCALARAGIALPAAARAELGWAPGFDRAVAHGPRHGAVRGAVRGALVGAGLGSVVAAALHAFVPRDANPAGAGLGTAWLLWAAGLPWSELVRAGAPARTPGWAVYGAMPAVAWAAWGALVGGWRARRAARA